MELERAWEAVVIAYLRVYLLAVVCLLEKKMQTPSLHCVCKVHNFRSASGRSV